MCILGLDSPFLCFLLRITGRKLVTHVKISLKTSLNIAYSAESNPQAQQARHHAQKDHHPHPFTVPLRVRGHKVEGRLPGRHQAKPGNERRQRGRDRGQAEGRVA